MILAVNYSYNYNLLFSISLLELQSPKHSQQKELKSSFEDTQQFEFSNA